MKSIFLLVFLASAISVASPKNSNEVLNCTVTKILNDNVFEEGLSVEEYPDVSVQMRLETACPMCPAFVTKHEARIGAFMFDESEKGTVITAARGTNQIRIVVSESWDILLSVSKNKALKIQVKDEKGEYRNVASGRCSVSNLR